MESPLATSAVAIATAIGAAAIIHFSPHGWPGLRASAPWWTAAGAALPPALYVLATYQRSDNPALWFAFGIGTAFVAGLAGLLIALFFPTTWRWWTYFLAGVAPWTIALAVYGMWVKPGPVRR